MNKLITYIFYGAVIFIAAMAGEKMYPGNGAPAANPIETNIINKESIQQYPVSANDKKQAELMPQLNLISKNFNY